MALDPMNSEQLSAAVRRVIDFTLAMDVERDYWEKASIVGGVLALGGDADIAAVREWMDRAVLTQDSQGRLNYSDRLYYGEGHVKVLTPTPVLSATLGLRVLDFYERTGDSRYLDAANRQAEALLATPRVFNGGFWNAWEGPELHIDIVYMVSPFLARLSKVTGESSWADEAVTQLNAHVEVLWEPRRKLTRHTWREVPDSFPQSAFWSRGNGWLACALAETIAEIPDNPGVPQLRSVLVEQLHSLSKLQDRSGLFRNILDDPGTNLEASGSLMYAYAVGLADRLGLEVDDLLTSAEQAFRAVAGAVTSQGAVVGVAVPPGGPTIPFGTAPLGQGFFLLAASTLASRLGITLPEGSARQ